MYNRARDRRIGDRLSAPRVVTVVQARCGSSRLPGKVLLPVLGQPLLARQVWRVSAAARVGRVVVATTTDPGDDAIDALCEQLGVPCFRGHATDLLDRHYQAARAHGAEIVVKIPSDCPLIDPAVIDRVLGVMLDEPGRWDYVSNLHPATWPDGNDVEAMTSDALATAWREADLGFEREHTTPYLWERPERFRGANVVWETGRDLSMSHRLTLDYPEDFALVRAIYERLYPVNPHFGLNAIVNLLAREPELLALNARYAGVNWYRHHLHELSTVTAAQTRSIDPVAAVAPKETP